VVLKRCCACTTLILSYDDDDDDTKISYKSVRGDFSANYSSTSFLRLHACFSYVGTSFLQYIADTLWIALKDAVFEDILQLFFAYFLFCLHAID